MGWDEQHTVSYTHLDVYKRQDWQRVADFNDFIDYADDTLYQGEGGTVWDLIPYQGDMYAVTRQ